MGNIIVQELTTKNPITTIGYEAGICWGSDISDDTKNYKRGLNCIKSNHGRALEFPQVYLTLDGYSARVIREWYTHIGGAPTRLQESTRYVDYSDGFDFVVPHSIKNRESVNNLYVSCMKSINDVIKTMIDDFNIPREDAAMLLPLGMTTRVVTRTNLRNLIDMSHQRMCNRAYWEYRLLFNDINSSLTAYSPEWSEIVDMCMMPKCDVLGYCSESHSCGRRPKKENDQ